MPGILWARLAAKGLGCTVRTGTIRPLAAKWMVLTRKPGPDSTGWNHQMNSNGVHGKRAEETGDIMAS